MFPNNMKGFLVTWYEMSSIEKDFSFGPEATVVAEVDGVSLDRESEPGVERAFFKGEGSITN